MQFSNRLICMGSVVAVCSVIAAWKLLTKSCVTRTTLQRDIKVPTETPPSLLRVLQCAKIVVFYASCGGTATTLANLLVETLGDREVTSVLLVSPESVGDLDSFSSMMGSCNLCLGIIATTGDGSIPQNFQRIFSFLRCASASGASHFSILALGDSKYQYYCKAGEDVAATLSQRGFCPCISDSGVTRSDAAQDPTHSRAYGLWVESILLTIPLHTDMVVGPLRTSPPIQRRFQVQSLVGDHGVDIGATIPFVLSPTMAEPTPTRPGRFSVKQLIRCLQADSEHQIAQITVGVNDYPKLTYEAGDHIAILSPNPTSVVDELLAFLDEGALTADTCVRIHHNTTSAARATPASSFPRPVVSWRFVLTWYLDISRVPAMQSVQHIIRCCDATTEEKVTMLGLVSDSSAYHQMLESLSQDLQHRPVRLVDVLRAKLPKTKSVPFDRLCECLPSLQPRYYSIASDPMSHVDGSLEIFVRLIKDGVASQHLASHPHHVYGFIRKSSFHLPKGRNKPILMIGPGTGIAPLLGFLHRRSAQMRKQQRSGSVQDNGPVWLFHGCRLREHYTHRIEGLVEAHVNSNALQHLFVCFSREETPRGTADRRYVQHVLEEVGEEVVKVLLQPTSVVFVCGDAARMARDVRQTLERLLCSAGMEPLAASNHLKKMSTSQRYLEDVW